MSTTGDKEPLPVALVEAVRSGNAVLFLGSGASVGAIHPKSEAIPSGLSLRDKLCAQFLGGKLTDRPLSHVAQLCENEEGRRVVQSFIREIFVEYKPAPFHLNIPRFRWHAIVTTNYDLIVERAYEQQRKSLQELVLFYKDNMLVDIESKKHQNPLQFLKLHGCISKAEDESAPLILTTEQYTRFKHSRARLFNRLQDWGHEFPLLFCGYSVSDPNIQTVLFDLFDDSIQRPNYYVVQPKIEEVEKRYWQKHRVVPIESNFEDFLERLDNAIPLQHRLLAAAVPAAKSSLSSFYGNRPTKESNTIVSFLEEDVVHIHPNMQTTPTDAKQYYKGYDRDFNGIHMDFDVPRTITDTILSDVVLVEESQRTNTVELVVLKGAAGNGKTTVLKRIAWEAAKEFNSLVLFLKEEGAIRNEQLAEIAAKAQRRIFLFVDRAALFTEEIANCLAFCRGRKIGITLLTAERDGEWNTRCESLEKMVSHSYPIRFFSEKEVHRLLEKLDKYDALGLLAERSYQERVRAFVDHAKRQILVALHEATQGKPFEDIVVDEYSRISPELAQQLYLDVCTLNQYGVSVRAGLISRMAEIRFDEFQREFFKPLENIVYATFDNYVQDYVYRSRHPHVAEMVVQQVLGDPQKRYDQLIRVMIGMNIDYSSDGDAFRRIIRGRSVATHLSSIELARSLYEYARLIAYDNPYVYHQEGVMELNHREGSVEQAERCFVKAEKLAPHDKSIQHSIAMMLRQKAGQAGNSLEREEIRQRALRRLSKLGSTAQRHAYEINARITILLDQLRDLVPSNSFPEWSEENRKGLVKKMEEIEKEIATGHQMFPSDEHLLSTEATYLELIDRAPQAIVALENAYRINPRLEWIGTRLADRHVQSGNLEAAKEVLRRVIQENPTAKRGHYKLGRILADSSDLTERAFALQHLRASFSEGDKNYDSQFWYARELFVMKQYEEAGRRFEVLKAADVPSTVRNRVKGMVSDSSGGLMRYSGRITKIEENYAFVGDSEFEKEVYAYQGETDSAIWEKLNVFDNVTFEIGFNYRGPVAINIRPSQDTPQ